MTVLDELKKRNIDPTKVIVEYRGEVYAPGADLSAIAYTDGETLNVFKVVAGG